MRAIGPQFRNLQEAHTTADIYWIYTMTSLYDEHLLIYILLLIYIFDYYLMERSARALFR